MLPKLDVVELCRGRDMWGFILVHKQAKRRCVYVKVLYSVCGIQYSTLL